MSQEFEDSVGLDEEVPFDAFAMDDVDPDRPGSGGDRLPEGGYQFLVTEIVVRNERGSTQVECEVLAAKDENLIGRKHIEYLRWPKADGSEVGNRIAKEQLLAWCYACKTTSAEEIKARQQARQGFDTKWLEAMVGRKCLGYTKEESYQDNAGNNKTSTKCDGRVWAIDDPKRRDIPGWIDSSSPAHVAESDGHVAPISQAHVEAPAGPFDGLV